MKYYIEVNNENPEGLYRVDENEKVSRWVDSHYKWQESLFSHRDIEFNGSKRVDPLTYEHPVFTKIQFYKDILEGVND